jgi:hypothetical protein
MAGRGGSPSFASASMSGDAVKRLGIQLAAQRAKLAAQGGAVPHAHHPSILERVLDIASRPNYAMAGMFGHTYDQIAQHPHMGLGGAVASMGSGFLRGLEGHDKYRFADVMQKAVDAGAPGSSIEKNRIVRGVGGFTADILTDPLTYIGGGVEKAGAKIGLDAAAGGAIAGGMGKGVSAADLLDKANVARDAAQAADKGALSLKVLGKPVARSELAYDLLSRAGRPVANSELYQAARRATSTAAAYPGKLRDYWRVGHTAGAAAFQDFDKSMTAEIASKLTKEEGSRITRAINEGVDLTGQVSHKGLDLGEAQQYWLDHKLGWDQSAQTLGISRAGQGDQRYIPAFFKTAAEKKEFLKEFSPMYRSVSQGAQGAHLPTLDEIIAKGFNPHTNIVDVMKLQAAQHWRDVAKAQFHHAAVAEYGVELAGKGAKAARDAAKDSNLVRLGSDVSPFFNNREIYVPKEVHGALEKLNKYYASDIDTAKLLRVFDSAQRIWKTGVTTVNPGHHLRNMAGDIFLNYEAGVTNPADYMRAFKVLTEAPGTVNIGGMAVPHDVLHSLYKVKGGASGFFNTELVGENLGKPLEVLRDVTAKREDMMRLANFVHSMKEAAKEAVPRTQADLGALAEKATARVRKFNFDYGDLTPLETNIRRVVPFYTFMRKNLPLQMEMLALHPNKIARIPQGFNALQQLLGTDDHNLPVTEMIPDYLRQMAAVRLNGEGGGLLHGILGKNPVYMNPSNPVTDAFSMFGSGNPNEVIRKQLAQTFPALRMGIELGTKTSLYSGAPISDNKRYLADQFPITRNILKAVAPKKPNRVIQPGEKIGGNPVFDLADWLTGAGVKEVTPQMQLSELKRQQSPVMTRLRSLRTQRRNAALRFKRR